MQLTITSDKPKLFVDMDGTLAEWKPIDIPLQVPSEKIKDYINGVLYQKGYYRNLKPYENVVEAIKQIIQEGKLDVYILSCVLPANEKYPDSTPLKDKNDWLDFYFGELIPQDHRIFVPDGEPKPAHIPFKLKEYDTLLDDFTKNLNDWVNTINGNHNNGKHNAIKLKNGINSTHKTWKGSYVSTVLTPNLLVKYITENIYSNYTTQKNIDTKTQAILDVLKAYNIPTPQYDTDYVSFIQDLQNVFDNEKEDIERE